MKQFAIAAITAMLLISCADPLPRRLEPVASRDETSVIVQNDFLRLVLDKVNKGSILALHDRASGKDLLSPNPNKRHLYRLVAVGADGKNQYFDNTQAKESLIRFHDDTLSITNNDHNTQPISVKVTCAISKDSPLTRWRIKVKNKSTLTIREIVFPCFVMKPETDCVLFPYCDGCLIETPNTTFSKGYRLSASYPGAASAQLMAAAIGNGGLYCAAHDAAGYNKGFSVARTEEGIELSTSHYPVDAPGNDFKQHYDVVAGPWQGTWCDAADIYKAWAIQQHWCAKTLIERGDIPDWLKRASMFLTVNLVKGEKDKPPTSLLDNVRSNVKSYSDGFRRPVCADLESWQGRGYYIAPHYFPPHGGNDKFKELTSGLRQDGNRCLVFLCDLFWTVEKKPPMVHQPYDDWECFKREGERYAIVGPDGKTAFSGVPDKKIGQNAILCPATRYTPKLMRGICKNCQKLGITMTQIETVGGGVPLCYSRKHQHKPGGGNYIAKALYDMYGSILFWGKLRDDDYTLSIEECGEYYIQVLTSYHSRDSAERSWPRSAPGVRGVPLFTYLYHEYALGWGGHGPNVSGKKRNRAGEYMSAAEFVCGKPPALSYWSTHVDAKDVDPTHIKMMKGIAAVLDGPACKYLMLGRMLHPIKLDVPETRIGFWNEAKKASDDLAFPAVLHSVWEYPTSAPKGITCPLNEKPYGHGYAFVNISEQDVEFTATLEPPLRDRMYAVRRYGEWVGPMEIAKEAAEPTPLTLKLKPGESTFVELLTTTRVLPEPGR